MARFTDIFDDVTKQGRKIPTNEYLERGMHPIIDQGQKEIAGYSNEEAGLFCDVPAIIFGDHTRVIKYVDTPCFLGADGVKLLKAKKSDANYKYLFYALSSADIPNTGYNRHFKWLKEVEIPTHTENEQNDIVAVLDKVSGLIALRKQQLTKLDELVKARFVELFGDPITNSKRLPTERMELRFNLKAGITTAADDIHDFEKGRYEIPCYGGNGIRGYVKEKSYEGNFPIIGRQGALCGNVQYATGKFHATEHAVLVSLLKDDNEVWVYYLLKLMDLYRYHTGAAQPGLSVKTLNTVDVIVADKCLQDQFAAFVKQTDKSKVAVQKALDEAQLLFDSLMQKYFG